MEEVMQILYRLSYRNHLASWHRTLPTVLGIMCVFAYITCLIATIQSCIQSLQTDGKGVFMSVIYLLIIIIMVSPGPMLYISTIMEENNEQYQILIASGTTKKQLFKSIFLESAFVLMCGTIPGVAAGYAIAWFLVNEIISKNAIENISFSCPFGKLISATLYEFLFILSLMLINALYILYSKRHRKPGAERPLKSRNVRLIRRFFGIGGVLGSVFSRNEKKRMSACLPSLVVSVLILVMMLSIFIIIKDPKGITFEDEKYDAYISLSGRTDVSKGFESALNQEKAIVSDMLREDRIRNVTSCSTYSPHVYFAFSDELLHTDLIQEESNHTFNSFLFKYGNTCLNSSSANGSKQHLVRFPAFVFYDDASFAKLAQKNNIDIDGQETTLLYNEVVQSGRLFRFLDQTPKDPLELHFFDYIDDDGKKDLRLEREEPHTDHSDSEFIFGNGSLPASLGRERTDFSSIYSNAYEFFNSIKERNTISVSVAGLLQSPPLGVRRGTPTLILPERMHGQFISMFDDAYVNASVYLNLSSDDYNKRVDTCADLCTRLSANHGCDAHESIVGIGSKIYDNKNSRTEYHFYVTDLKRSGNGILNYKNLKKDSAGGLVYAILIGLPFIALFANTLVIAHLNRSIRLGEYATLTILGIRKKQKIGMLVFESILYGVRSVLYSLPFVLLLFPIIFLALSFSLSMERTISIETLSRFSEFTVPLDSFGVLFKTMLDMLKLLGWCMLPIMIVIFSIFFFSSLIIKNLMDPDDLIRIVKESSYK